MGARALRLDGCAWWVCVVCVDCVVGIVVIVVEIVGPQNCDDLPGWEVEVRTLGFGPAGGVRYLRSTRISATTVAVSSVRGRRRIQCR